MSEFGKRKYDALELALRVSSSADTPEQIVAKATAFFRFLIDSDTPTSDPEEQGIDRTLPVGLFDQMHEHEKADTKPWRSSRGLE